MRADRKSVLDRIQHFEEAISKGREYLATGAHAQWKGFRPLFAAKTEGGKPAPPHPDWVKNVFLPRHERALLRAEKALEKLKLRRSEKAVR